jgi:predicted ATPase
VLIRFEVSNFRSILDPVELSMVAVDRDRPEARWVENIGESLLPVAAIYGPNASGKSNVIAAMNWLSTSIRDSLRVWDDTIPVEPFAFGEGPRRPSEFTVESIIDGVRFEYVLELDQAGVRYEALFHYPEKKRRRIFEREGQDLKLQRGLGNLSGTRELLTPRSLALTIARRFDEPLVTAFADDLVSIQVLNISRSGMVDPHRAGRSARIFDRRFLNTLGGATQLRAEALGLLRMADLGIDDVVVDDEANIFMLHQTDREPSRLSYLQESAGTRTWFELIYPVLTARMRDSLVLFDELDATLHPTLSMHLIGLFTDPTTNPKGAQLIFAAHDTSLLNHLNRDEVWLTEKVDGVTRLGALAEFAGERVRKSQNLEKAYLGGRFGALPDVDRVEFLRALGLIG